MDAEDSKSGASPQGSSKTPAQNPAQGSEQNPQQGKPRPAAQNPPPRNPPQNPPAGNPPQGKPQNPAQNPEQNPSQGSEQGKPRNLAQSLLHAASQGSPQNLAQNLLQAAAQTTPRRPSKTPPQTPPQTPPRVPSHSPQAPQTPPRVSPQTSPQAPNSPPNDSAAKSDKEPLDLLTESGQKTTEPLNLSNLSTSSTPPTSPAPKQPTPATPPAPPKEGVSITHLGIWRLALPAIFANTVFSLSGVIDAAVLGRLDAPIYLAAIGIGANVFALIYWTFGSMGNGISGLVGQAYGAGDGSQMRRILLRTVFLMAAIGLSLALAGPFIADVVVGFFGAEQQVTEEAQAYLAIRFLDAPAVLVIYAFIGFLRGCRLLWRILLIFCVTTTLNLLLDVYFVFGLEWKTAGVAWATVATHYLGFAVACLEIARAMRLVPHGLWSASWTLGNQKRLWAWFAGFNGFMILRTLLLLAAFIWMTRLSASLGTLWLAVTIVLRQWVTIVSFVLDGIADAADASISQAIGSGDRDAFYRVIKITSFWVMSVALGMSLALAAASEFLVPLVTDQADVIEAANLIVWILIVFPFFGAPAYLMDGLFLGAAAVRQMFVSMVIAIAVFVPLSFYATEVWGAQGLWLSFCVFILLRAITLGWFVPSIIPGRYLLRDNY